MSTPTRGPRDLFFARKLISQGPILQDDVTPSRPPSCVGYVDTGRMCWSPPDEAGRISGRVFLLLKGPTQGNRDARGRSNAEWNRGRKQGERLSYVR